MKRREFSREQRAQMIRRASDEKGNIHCEGRGLNVTGKAIEFDHTIAEALILDKSRPLTIDDGKVLGKDCCHRGPDGKTARDAAMIAQAKRREARHLGAARPAGTLKGPGFTPASPQRRASQPIEKFANLPRRSFYGEVSE